MHLTILFGKVSILSPAGKEYYGKACKEPPLEREQF